MITIYGISNCDTVKRARKALAQGGIEHRFHDFRKDGIDPDRIQAWLDELGADLLVNRRGTTWRGLDSASQQAVDDGQAAQVLARHSSVIKRPVIDRHGALRVGFAKKDENEILDWLRE